MDCGRVSFCLCGDPDYFSITTRPWLPHSSQSFTINCGLFAAILDENVGIYQFFHNSNKQDLKHATSIIWTTYICTCISSTNEHSTYFNWHNKLILEYWTVLQPKHYFGIWDHAKSNRHPEVWELQHSNDFLYLWCLKSHMAVADLILNKIRVLCNCWSHLDSWLIQHNAFVSPSPGYNGSPSNWSQRAAPECGPTVIYFN